MNQEYKLAETDLNVIPDHITTEDIRYFEDKVKRNPWDKKAQLQLELIKKHFGVKE